MEIRYLKLIKAIVEEGSITRAMDILHLSQSALSYQLKEVEQQVGTLLFYRRNKKLILTPVGKKLYSTANKIIRELDTVEAEIKKMMQNENGVIRISTECYTSYHWLPPVLKKFQEKFPNVEIEIVFEATHRPIEKLIQGELDLAITSNPEEIEQVEFINLFTDEMFALVSHKHPWAELDYVSAEDFRNATLIIHSLPLDTVSIFRTQLLPKSIKPKKLIILPLTEAAIELVKANMGVIVMANWALQPYLTDHLHPVRINPGGFFRQQYIARIRDREYPAYFDCFISFLKEEINLSTGKPQKKNLNTLRMIK